MSSKHAGFLSIVQRLYTIYSKLYTIHTAKASHLLRLMCNLKNSPTTSISHSYFLLKYQCGIPRCSLNQIGGQHLMATPTGEATSATISHPRFAAFYNWLGKRES